MPRLQVIRRGLDPKRQALAQGLAGAGEAIGQGFKQAAFLENSNQIEGNRVEAKSRRDAESMEDKRIVSMMQLQEISQDPKLDPPAMQQLVKMHESRFQDSYDQNPSLRQDFDIILNRQSTKNRKFKHEEAGKEAGRMFDSIKDNMIQEIDDKDTLVPNAREQYLAAREIIIEKYGDTGGEEMDRLVDSWLGSVEGNIFDEVVGQEQKDSTFGFGGQEEINALPGVIRTRDLAEQRLQAQQPPPPPQPQFQTGVTDDGEIIPGQVPGPSQNAPPPANPNAPADLSGLAQGLQPGNVAKMEAHAADNFATAATQAPGQPDIPPWYETLNGDKGDSIFVGDKGKKNIILKQIDKWRGEGVGWDEITQIIKEKLPEVAPSLGIQ